MASLQTSDAVIFENDDEVELWYLTGVPRVYFPTKIAAEAWARERFPLESPDDRYARVFYARFIKESSL